MSFEKSKYMTRIQGKEYLPVSARLVWFREEHPDWGIYTEAVEINLEKQYAIFKTTIFNAEGKLMATATKMENVRGFADFLEKAETGSVGRALAYCGYGTQFEPQFDMVDSDGVQDVVDAPQARVTGTRNEQPRAEKKEEQDEEYEDFLKALNAFRTALHAAGKPLDKESILTEYNRLIPRPDEEKDSPPPTAGLIKAAELITAEMVVQEQQAPQGTRRKGAARRRIG